MRDRSVIFPYRGLWEEFRPQWEQIGAWMSRKLSVEPPRMSVVEVQPRARILHREVEPLLKPFGLKLEVEIKLQREIRDIMSEYLGPSLLPEHIADHARSLQLLPMIARTSSELVDQLSEIDQSFLAKLDQHRSESLPANPEEPGFHFPLLIRQLRRLSLAAERVEAAAEPKPRGGVEKARLDHAIGRLVVAVRRADLDVSWGHSGSSTPRWRLVGKGSELIRDIFQTFDRHVGVSEICNSLTRTGIEKDPVKSP